MTMTPLKVPFKEKDEAKKLGARWNPQERYWYVPSGLNLTAFQRWLPEDSLPTVSHPPEPLQPLQPLQPLEPQEPQTSIHIQSESLGQLLQRLRAAVQAAAPAALWVRAELVRLNAKGRHMFLELAEHDADQQLVAQASAALWEARRRRIEDRFKRATGGLPQEGMALLLQVEVDLDPRRGLRLAVLDIDPAYTLGEMAAKLQHIRETLQYEGVFEHNRRLPAPREFCRVAVISPAGAAGLGDFHRDATRLEARDLVRFDYYTAVFESATAPQSLIETLAVVAERHSASSYDAIVLIRGGGAVTGLNYLNDLSLARTLCQFPLPAFTGIGHERDNTILDEIAHRRFDTPSKVIGFIRDSVVANARQAQSDMQTIQQTATRRIAALGQIIESQQVLITQHTYQALRLQQTTLHVLHDRLAKGAQRHLRQAAEALTHDYRTVVSETRRQTRTLNRALGEQRSRLLRQVTTRQRQGRQTLERETTAVMNLANRAVPRARGVLDQYFKLLMGYHPRRILARGYALVHAGEQTLTSRREALAHQQLELEFHDGRVPVSRIPNPETEDDHEFKQ